MTPYVGILQDNHETSTNKLQGKKKGETEAEPTDWKTSNSINC